MKQILYIFSVLFLLGCEKELQPVQIAVSTGDATNITTNSASIQVSMDKNDLINEIGVFCSTDSLFNSNTVNKSSIQTITGTHFNFQLSNLSDGTKYFYKAYASGKSNSIYGITKSFTTEQLQLSTSINNIEAGDLENTYSVKINSNTDWHASSNQNWCEVSPNTGTTNSTINILLKANTTTSARQAIVTVTAGNKEQKITINQKGCHENLAVSSNYFSVSPENKSYNFVIYTNMSWEASSDQSWCVLSSSSGNGENTLSFNVSENTTGLERKAVVKVKSGSLTQEITIIQQSKSATLSVSTNIFSVNADRNTYNFSITSNLDWTITSDQSWCTPSIAAGSNNQTVSFVVSENTSTQERRAMISVKAGTLLQQITVTQTGTSQTLAVSKNSFLFFFFLWQGEFTISSNTNWNISSDKSWCSVATTSGSNNKTVSFLITENTSTQRRSAIITVETSSSSIQIVVTQEGKTEVLPNLSVSPGSISVTASEQTSSFDITSNSNWTITSNQTWCTPSVTFGSGDKTVTCSIDENTQSQTRTATMTISAGNQSRTVTIEQEGKEVVPSLSVSPETILVTASEQTSSFDITSNSNWTIASNQTWCTPSVTSGNGDKTITCSIDENTLSQSRTATMTITAGNQSRTVTIEQEGKEITIVNIPDANFKAYLVKNFDIDKDGEISINEARKITYLALQNSNITSLEGIQYLTSITYMSCYNNQIREIDLSKCTELERLTVGENNLTSINISNNTKLKELNCAYNSISHLDLSNNLELTNLYCIENNLSSLDVSNNILLEELQCSNNKLSVLDIRKNKNLTYLTCANNSLQNIDVQNNILLETFYCCSNQFTTLDLSKNINLVNFECCRNQITNIDFSNNSKLSFINIYNNQLKTLDVSSNPLLNRLDCWGNPLETLILKKGQTIEILNGGNNYETVYK